MRRTPVWLGFLWLSSTMHRSIRFDFGSPRAQVHSGACNSHCAAGLFQADRALVESGAFGAESGSHCQKGTCPVSGDAPWVVIEGAP